MLLFYCTHGAALAAFLSTSLSAQLSFCPECRSSHVCDEPPLPECRSSQVCNGPGEAFVCGEPPLPEPFMCLASHVSPSCVDADADAGGATFPWSLDPGCRSSQVCAAAPASWQVGPPSPSTHVSAWPMVESFWQ